MADYGAERAPIQLANISHYIKQSVLRQKNAEALRQDDTISASQVKKAEQDALVYALIGHTMALENERFFNKNGKYIYD